MKSTVRVPSCAPFNGKVNDFNHLNVYNKSDKSDEEQKYNNQREKVTCIKLNDQLSAIDTKCCQHNSSLIHMQMKQSENKSNPNQVNCSQEQSQVKTILDSINILLLINLIVNYKFHIQSRYSTMILLIILICKCSIYPVNGQMIREINVDTIEVIDSSEVEASSSSSPPSLPSFSSFSSSSSSPPPSTSSSARASVPEAPFIPTPSAVYANDPLNAMPKMPGPEDDINYDPLAEDEQRDFVDPCCACEEAKYEVIFEGLWSKYTHPKDFPENVWLTHFSDIIGASHSPEFKMWDYNGYASEGLQQVAELGITKKLEAELKTESAKIRTIIKARGLWYPNLNGKTFAVFRVDQRNHLMSLVSMLGPSPDWFVGVSSLELCMKNCSWIPEKIINLYLWDAGTDSGISYLSPNQPTVPVDRIKKIRTNYPASAESPFYDTGNGLIKMKPFVKLTVTRQRIYEKSCDDNANTIDGNRGNQDSLDTAVDDTRCKY